MYKTIWIMIIVVIMLGCAKESDLIINNNTNHQIYYSINDGETITLEGLQSEKHTFHLGKQYLLNKPDKTIELFIEGQTYELPFGYTATEVNLEADSDYKVFLWPTHAMVKIINDSDDCIFSIKYMKNYVNNVVISENLLPLGTRLNSGESIWFRIPALEDNLSGNTFFYYTFEVTDVYDQRYFFGDQDTILMKDDAYTIVFQSNK
ncbi:MAG: hypothetical protein PHY08_01345 [Candidatus Cloacimonetes bacterium]|nr:hypothetical protein [Candidatus Cloacimonadota bacterium]MDD4155192.1 hypothetical protein [Candidatus Cloacimonadota bacterium]